MGVGELFMEARDARASLGGVEEIAVDVVGQDLACGEEQGELLEQLPWQREGGGCAEDGAAEGGGEAKR